MAAPTTAYRPILFLGLGGTGKEILLRLRLRMHERFRTHQVPFARFLWVDTDTRATDARGQDLSKALGAMGFGEHEKFTLLEGAVGKDLRDIFQNPGQWPHIHEWLYPQVRQFGSEIADGAGGVRAVGRLTFFAKYVKLREQIESRLNELSQLETINKTQNFFRQHGLPSVGTDSNSSPTIFVVTSVAGGTGCGTFLDVGFMLRDIKKTSANVSEIFSYAILPNVYNASPQGEIAQRSFANAYAALKELDHFTKRIKANESLDAKEGNPYSDFIVSWRRDREERIEGPPYSVTYLIELNNEAKLPIAQENRGDLFGMLAETLFLDLLPGPFSDAKRSNYSNIVQALAGASGVNTVSERVNFKQTFARRYASCGMSKIEIPMDAVRAACAEKLEGQIFRYILRDKEDSDAARGVLRDLAAFEIDENGIFNRFGMEWKQDIHDDLTRAVQNAPLKTPDDVVKLRGELDRIEHAKLLVDSDRLGTIISRIRARTPTVNRDARQSFDKMLTERIFENPERGLATSLRENGYLQLAVARTRELITPSREETLSVLDQRIKDTEADADDLRAQKDAHLRELDAALRSVPAAILAAREQVVKIVLERVRDIEEQYLYALGEKELLQEARKVAQELARVMIETRGALLVFLDKANTILGSSVTRLAASESRLKHGSHVLFLQLFDSDKHLPEFYRLDDAEVDPRKEYRNLLLALDAPDLARMAEMLRHETTDAVGHRVSQFCERRFHGDLSAHPRAVNVLDHPMLHDPATASQVIQNFVNQARPMLRRDEKLAASNVESTTFAYLGIANKDSPEASTFIKRVQDLAQCNVETIDTGSNHRNEIFLYFSSFAFPLPSLTLVQNDCHHAYTDFYSQFNPGQARQATTGIPLHLSERWEGRYDDLVIYSDREAELLEEVLGIVNLAPSLHVLTVVDPDKRKSTALPDYIYRDAPPLSTSETLGKRRMVIARLMKDTFLRRDLADAVQARENQLTPDQLKAFFWSLRATLLGPDMEAGTPDYQLLSSKFTQVYHRLLQEAPHLAGQIDTDRMPATGQLAWIRSQGFGLDWPDAGPPVVSGLELWRRPVRYA